MIQNRQSIGTSPARDVALDCIAAAVEAANPETATESALSLEGDTLRLRETTVDLSEYTDIVVVGGGKAAGGVTRALESVLADRITDGHVLVTEPANTETVRVTVGDHPLPSDRNVAATADMLELVDDADAATLVLFVLTGGASALLCAPAADLTVTDLQTTTERLLEGGVPIAGLNAVRKHLSAVKGGQVATRGAPGTVMGLLMSDVVGNDRSTIGSGPTVPDTTTFEEALAVFDRHGVTAPDAVRRYLEAGVDGKHSETPSDDSEAFQHVDNQLLCDTATALAGAADAATAAGYEPLVLTSRLRGEAKEVAKPLVGTATEAAVSGTPVEPPAVLLAGGETTVTVGEDGGRGGPNQELVLSAALGDLGDVVVAAADTDGEDGRSDAAGAVADGTTITDPERAREALRANDAGTYLADAGATIHTGPTGTNVNDVVVLVVPA